MNHASALLIDDHAIFRFGLRQVVESALPDLRVVEANSIIEALSFSLDNVVLILLDNKFSGLSGIAGISMLRQKWSAIPILMLSSEVDSETVRIALERGAVGFLSKGESVETIVLALRRAVAGEAQSTTTNTQSKNLTPRQLATLSLLQQGMQSKQIARELCIAENTARKHVQDVIEFFGATSRAEAVFAARKRGFIS